MSKHAFCVLALAGGLFAACGGGGGASGRLASVALLLAEERSDAESVSVAATLTEVALVPEAGGDPIVLFGSDRGEEIDLTNSDLLVSVVDGIEPGRYGRVHMSVASLRLEGEDCGDIEVVVPEGTITLIPHEAFTVDAGDTLSVRISIDIDKSMEHHALGCTFRPVLEIRSGDGRLQTSGECPSTVTGTVTEVADDGTSGVLSIGKNELTFLIGDGTAIFDEDGLPSDASEVVVDAELTIKGLLNDESELDALVIVVGEVLAVEGKVETAFDAGTFVLLPDEDEEVVGDLDVAVDDTTLILLDCAEGSTDNIIEGTRLVVFGKFDTGSGTLLAFTVEIGPAELEGEITAITEVTDGFEITLLVDGEEDPRTLFVGTDVDIHLQGDGPIPIDLLAGLLECGTVQATVFVAVDDPTVVVDVAIQESDLEGDATDIDTSAGLMTVDGSVVGVMSGATIIDLREDFDLISLGDIEDGDRLRVFGLEACDGDEVEFFAFVILVLPEQQEGEECEENGQLQKCD